MLTNAQLGPSDVARVARAYFRQPRSVPRYRERKHVGRNEESHRFLRSKVSSSGSGYKEVAFSHDKVFNRPKPPKEISPP